jgi:geranylgeranyl diphosphate synthase, type II
MLSQTLETGRSAIDAALEQLLPPADAYPTSIHRAMRHSVFAGGKRLRPILCLEAARAVTGAVPSGINRLGAALEMLHTYSLVHDDLPALDNDDLRRGQPTCHKAFGEATAILAGDGLQTLAYQVLAELPCSGEQRARIVAEVARATGTVEGMIGGQVVDLESESQRPDATVLEYIHRAKTGALIAASVVSGGIYANGSPAQIAALRGFGRAIGLAFQIVDDVLDATADSAALGKTAGKDQKAGKATYVSVHGIARAREMADGLLVEARDALRPLGPKARVLDALAALIVERRA